MTKYERIILGQILRTPKVYDKAKLENEDFISKDGLIIFQGLGHLIGKGVRPDYINLAELCRGIEAHEIATLTDDIPTSANWSWYADKIKEEAVRHRLNKLLNYGKEALEQGTETAEMLAQIQVELDGLTSRGQRYEIITAKQAVQDYMQEVERRYQLKGELPGYSTGYQQLDKQIMGMQNEAMIVVGARPSDGKTALMKELSNHVALEGHAVGVISTESSVTEYMNRTFSGMAEINSQQLKSGVLKEEQFKTLHNVAAKVYETDLYLYDMPNATLEQIKKVARNMILHNGVKIIFIDYLQNINHTIKGAPRHEAVAEVSAELKALARRYKIPVVVMAQLRRPNAHEKKSRPVMSDLGDSRRIEQDADVILMIWHERTEDGKEITDTEFIIRKNRDGPLGTIKMKFEPWFVRFREVKDER